MIVDSHVHVWDPERIDYPWLRSVPALDGPRLPGDLPPGADAVVFVEADAAPTDRLAEAEWVATLAWPELARIVAAVDLLADDLPKALERRIAIPRVAGVRHLLQDLPLALFPEFTPGLLAIADRGLTFDACVRHRQLDTLADLLEGAPETVVVLDHLGKPPLDDGLDSEPGRAWRSAIDRLAALPSVSVKISGLAAETSDRALFAAHADAFVRHALDAFGADRAMLGSDWPVSTTLGVAESFADHRARVRAASRASDAEWAAITHGTAQRIYRFGADAASGAGR